MAFIGPELSGNSYDGELFAIPKENCAFTRCNEDEAVDAVVYVDIGGDVKDEKGAVFAVVEVELLLFD